MKPALAARTAHGLGRVPAVPPDIDLLSVGQQHIRLPDMLDHDGALEGGVRRGRNSGGIGCRV